MYMISSASKGMFQNFFSAIEGIFYENEHSHSLSFTFLLGKLVKTLLPFPFSKQGLCSISLDLLKLS